MNPAPTYARDVLDLLDRAEIPTTCPPMLRPGDIERVLNISRDDRLSFERDGWLVPTSRTPGGERRYSQADLARAILDYGLRTYWGQLEPET